MTTITIPLSYARPPLTTNRLPRNLAHRQRVIDEIQAEVGWRLKAMKYRAAPISHPVQVCLVWTVTDNRVRDSSGPDPTLKAAQDALVTAGVLADDRHEIVVRSFCRIEKGNEFGMRLEISDVFVPAIILPVPAHGEPTS